MRPLSFRSDELRSLLLRSKIATLDELKQALGTSVDVTVFRKLKPLDYLTSYSHRGRYYTLREIALFDEKGLWSHATVWFSQFGTLLSTAESFVNRSPRGYFADELARAVHVDVQDALHQLAQQRRVTRQIVSGMYLYTAVDRTVQQGQLLTRRDVEAVPTVVDASVLEVSEEELKASILLFYSLGGYHRSKHSPGNSGIHQACWTSSSAACMPVWSRSNWGAAAIAAWPPSLTSILTRWRAEDSSY
jgi:hypothetical protein